MRNDATDEWGGLARVRSGNKHNIRAMYRRHGIECGNRMGGGGEADIKAGHRMACDGTRECVGDKARVDVQYSVGARHGTDPGYITKKRGGQSVKPTSTRAG
jgi:hypothetical protein